MTGPTHDSYAALRIRNFRWYLVSHGTMTVATQIQAVVVGWQIYAITKDPLSLGLIGLAEALPFISIALFSGHVADRAHRQRVAIASLVALLGCSVALLTLTVVPGALSHHRTWPMYSVIFISGIARSFLRPSSTALSAEIVPRDLYPNAVAWRTSIWQFAAVAGPAIGGLLYGFASIEAAYITDATLMVVSAGAFARIAYSHTKRPDSEHVPVGESLMIGIRFLFQQPVLIGAMTLDLFSVLFGGAVALLPVFAADILHVGPQGLGLLRAAPAAGSVLMALFLAHRPPLPRAGLSLFIAVAIFGASMIGFGLSRNFLLSVALLALSGMADNISVVIRSTLLQIMTPRALLGRVSSVNQIFVGSSNEIGAFESGVTARYMGTVPSVIFGGAMTLAVVIVTAWRIPQLRSMARLSDVGSDDAGARGPDPGHLA